MKQLQRLVAEQHQRAFAPRERICATSLLSLVPGGEGPFGRSTELTHRALGGAGSGRQFEKANHQRATALECSGAQSLLSEVPGEKRRALGGADPV